MHNPGAMRRPEGKPKATRGREVLAPEVEAEQGAYRLPSGQLFLLADAVRNAAVKAAAGLRVKPAGGGRAEFVTSLIKAGIFLLDEQLPLYDPVGGEAISKYEIDQRRVVNQSTKGGMLVARPKVPKWTAAVTLEWAPEVLPETLVTEMLTRAGRRVGVGAYRVEKGGPFGRFSAELLDVTRDA